MLFVCHPKILHKHCLQFLLGVKMVPRESEDNAYTNFGVTDTEHYCMLSYFLSWSILNLRQINDAIRMRDGHVVWDNEIVRHVSCITVHVRGYRTSIWNSVWNSDSDLIRVRGIEGGERGAGGYQQTWVLCLESPGNFSGLKPNIKVKM